MIFVHSYTILGFLDFEYFPLNYVVSRLKGLSLVFVICHKTSVVPCLCPFFFSFLETFSDLPL